MFFQVMASNMVHPVTPTFLTQLEMPDFMFGAAFAAMSVTNFLFCPFWGRMGDSVGRIRTLVITTLGYTLGQICFLFASSIPAILFARMFAGLFGGGCTVTFMAYIADVSQPEHCGQNMSICAAVTAAGTAAGYLVGGVLGDVGVSVTFWSQCGILLTLSVLMAVLLRDGPYYAREKFQLGDAVNPFSAFAAARGIFTPRMCVFLLVVLLSCFATTAFDNSFNFYIKDQFGFPPSYNGYIYAAVGLIGLVVNFTLGLWLQRRKNCRGSLALVLALSGAALFISLLFRSVVPFIGVNMLFYVANSMYLPLQQALMIRDSDAEHGKVSGIFVSIRAVGMIAGSLSAGFLYELLPQLPLFVGACAFALAAGFCCVNLLQYRRAAEAHSSR